MATVALATAGELEVVIPGEQKTLTAGADLAAATFVREDASGNWVQALATTAPNAAGARLALRTVKSGEALTAARTGTYGGFTISQAFNAGLFLSDTGTLADAAGTVSTSVGRVRAAQGNLVGSAKDKLVELDCPE